MAFKPGRASTAAPLRILHVTGGVNANYGGPTAALLALLEILQGQPAQIGVAIAMTDAVDEPVLQRLRALSSDVWSYSRERLHPWAFSAAFSRELPKLVQAYDVVHVHSMWTWAPYWALRTAGRASKPVIIRPAGALDPFDLQKHRGLKKLIGPRLLRRHFEPPNVFHCTARREATNLETYGGRARREVLPLPVADDALVGSVTRADARAELGIPPEAKVILFLGRMNYKKGLEVLIPALALVRRTAPEIMLLLAGDGEDEIKGMVQRMTAELGLREAIRQLGFVAGRHKAATLAASDLFVLPSMNENFGVSVIESLQAGVPVLISRDVYIADDIADGQTVSVCERTPEAVAQGILKILQAGRNGEARAADARAIWTQRYSPAVLRPAYWDFYSRVARSIFP